jgi:hypothetical protein
MRVTDGATVLDDINKTTHSLFSATLCIEEQTDPRVGILSILFLLATTYLADFRLVSKKGEQIPIE